MTRRGYLDWLRGVAVLIMVAAHLFDAWVRLIDRADRPYRSVISVGGYSAPLFLFLAGLALMLAVGSGIRKGASGAEVAALARKRGWQVFGLAFLFRLQSFLISGGAFPQTVLKVDILNVMGPSMLLAAVLWAFGKSQVWRATFLVAGAVLIAMVTPIVRAMPLPESLPYVLAWYLRSVPGSGAFSLFPWVGFLLAGGAIGIWLDAARSDADERRVIRALSLVGPLVVIGGLGASYLPPLFPSTTFWTGSPTFFFVRLGILMSVIPIAYFWNRWFRGWSPLRVLGLSSLFVYWIHVEMVYGVVSLPLHKALSFGQAVAAYVAFCLFLFWLVTLKNRFVGRASAPPHRGPRLSSAHQTSGSL